MAQKRPKTSGKPFDVASKKLIQDYPEDWLRFLGVTSTDFEIIDTDLSTVVASSDKAFLLRGEKPEILHIEIVSSYKADAPIQFLEYSVILLRRHALPIRTIVILLSQDCDGPALRTTFKAVDATDEWYLQFRFRTIQAWKIPYRVFLNGGLGTMPFALLSDDAQEQLPQIVSEIKRRIETETDVAKGEELWASMYLLMGLKLSSAVTDTLMKGVFGMENSTTYQAIIAEGELRGEARGEAKGEARGEATALQGSILRIGTKFIGKPDLGVQRKIKSVFSPQILAGIEEVALEAKSWEEIVAKIPIQSPNLRKRTTKTDLS